MNEQDQGRKFTDKSAAIANEALAKGKRRPRNLRRRLNKAAPLDGRKHAGL